MATPRTRASKKLPARRPTTAKLAPSSARHSVVLRLTEDLDHAPPPVLEAILNTLRVGGNDLKNAILTRCLTLTSRVIERVPSRILAEAAAASSDQEAMLRLLEAPEMAVAAAEIAAIDAARARGVEARDQLIRAEGGSWSVEDTARYLGLTRQAVDKRRKANKLMGLALGRHGYLYPSWQFTMKGTLAGLEDVLLALRRHDSWAQVIFMLSPNDRLDGTSPLAALRDGRIEDVKLAASLFGEHGAA